LNSTYLTSEFTSDDSGEEILWQWCGWRPLSSGMWHSEGWL